MPLNNYYCFRLALHQERKTAYAQKPTNLHEQGLPLPSNESRGIAYENKYLERKYLVLPLSTKEIWIVPTDVGISHVNQDQYP